MALHQHNSHGLILFNFLFLDLKSRIDYLHLITHPSINFRLHILPDISAWAPMLLELRKNHIGLKLDRSVQSSNLLSVAELYKLKGVDKLDRKSVK